nr:hypothetical protein [Tanacetum cinerariifolium]
MEAGGKDRPPMLAPGNYVQWKSKIKRYIDTKPNHELIQYCLKNPSYKFTWADKEVPFSEVDACSNACEMWKAIERLKQGESINVQDLETNLYWEFRKFTSQDGESLESYYSRFYKMMNELFRNQCDVTNHQVNVQFLLQLQPEWKMFVTLVKQSQELKTVSFHKLYDILKQHQNEVNEIRAERIACIANPLALVAQQQPVYHPQNHHTNYTQNSSTRSQQAATRNRGKDKEIDKLMALISLSFTKIYKPTNNNLRTSSNTSTANQDNSPRINRGAGYDNQRSQQAATRNRGKPIVNFPLPIYDQEPSMVVEDDKMSKDKEIDKLMALISLSGAGYDNQRLGNVARARETVETKTGKGSYHKEKMLLCKQVEARFQLSAEQADWKDDTDDEPEDQELEAHYMYMAQIQEVTPDVAGDSGPIFETEPLQKVPNNDNYNVFSIECEHPEQSKSVNDTYPIVQDEHNMIIDSLHMSYDREQIDQNDDDLSNERDLLASLIEKLKCEFDDSKNRNNFLETSNKVLVDKLKGQMEDFKTKNKSLESSNNRFKEANNKLSETNELM